MRSVTVFARRPSPGMVKTRLSPALPPAEACRLYRGMLLDAIDAAADSGADRRLVHWAGPTEGHDAWTLPPGVESVAQSAGDLGRRLSDAFAALLASPGDRAVAIGADCPELDGRAIDEGLARLDDHDVVLAPSADGGYALIGLRRPEPSLFEGVDWGGPAVLEQTLARAARRGLSVARLAARRDVDTPADLIDWIARRLAGPRDARGRRTDDALAALGLLPPR